MNPRFAQNKFFSAAEKGDAEGLASLLRDPFLNVNKVDAVRRTALCICAEKRHKSAFNVIVHDPRTDFHTLDLKNRTPFWWICYHGNVDAALTLLQLASERRKLFDPLMAGWPPAKSLSVSPLGAARLGGKMKESQIVDLASAVYHFSKDKPVGYTSWGDPTVPTFLLPFVQDRSLERRQLALQIKLEAKIDSFPGEPEPQYIEGNEAMSALLQHQQEEIADIVRDQEETLLGLCCSITRVFWAINMENNEPTICVRLNPSEKDAWKLPDVFARHPLLKISRQRNYRGPVTQKTGPPEIPATSLDVTEVLKIHSRELMTRPGVTAVFGSTFRLRGGLRGAEHCVVVFVHAKGFRYEGEEVLPAVLQGAGGQHVGVDVRQGALEFWGGGADAATEPCKVVQMGSEIKTQSGSSGSLGFFARKSVTTSKKETPGNGNTVNGFISCCHPFRNSRGDMCAVHGSVSEKILLADIPFHPSPPWNSMTPMDAAFFSIHASWGKAEGKFEPRFVVKEKRFWESSSELGVAGPPRLCEEPSTAQPLKEGDILFKVGKTTGITTGVMGRADGAAKLVEYWIENRPVQGREKKTKDVEIYGLITIEARERQNPFSNENTRVGSPGDSGAPLCRLNPDNSSECYPVGVLLGGCGDPTADWPGTAVVTPIETILQQLGVSIIYP